MPAYRLISRPCAFGYRLSWTMIAPDFRQAIARAQADDPLWCDEVDVQLLPSTVGVEDGIKAMVVDGRTMSQNRTVSGGEVR